MFDFLRNLTKSDADKQQERLSAYLDNGLTPAERSAFEAEMKADTVLQASLERDRAIKQNLSALPRMRAPRNFTLDPAVYGRPTPSTVFRLYPVMRTATVLAAVMLIFVFSLEFIGPSAVGRDTISMAPEAVSQPVAAGEAAVEESAAEEAAVLMESEVVVEEEMAEAPMEAPAEEPPAVFEAEEAAPDEEAMAESANEAAEESAGETNSDAIPAEADGAAGGATEEEGLAVAPNAADVEATPETAVTATQRLTQTEQAGADTTALEPVSPAIGEGANDRIDEEPDLYGLDDAPLRTRSLLLGGLGALFLALLAGTFYLRRQI